MTTTMMITMMIAAMMTTGMMTTAIITRATMIMSIVLIITAKGGKLPEADVALTPERDIDIEVLRVILDAVRAGIVKAT